jgi:hypothetical protein
MVAASPLEQVPRSPLGWTTISDPAMPWSYFWFHEARDI